MYESREDYLEAILILKEKNGFARSVDIANHLGVSKPSVSRAMDVLSSGGFITFGIGNTINFTQAGEEKAREIYSRHRLLTVFFEKIAGVPRSQAEENACRVEHAIDEDIVAGIRNWLEKNK